MVYIKEAVSNDTSRYGSMVEQLICNQQVVGSSPIIGFIFFSYCGVEPRYKKEIIQEIVQFGSLAQLVRATGS